MNNIETAIEKTHKAVWERFVYQPLGILLDYAGLDGQIELPSQQDYTLGKSNAISWWTPMENGAFFNGLYLDGLCKGWRITGEEKYKEGARIMAQGLLQLAQISDMKGFIARGLSADGLGHYPIGSDDQTGPWFYGLWRYLKSALPAASERKIIIDLMTEVAETLEAADWKLPCDGAFKGQTRGGLKEYGFRPAASILFIYRAMMDITGNQIWLERYEKSLYEKPKAEGKSRLEICENGMLTDFQQDWYFSRMLWISANAQLSLKALIEMETDASIKEKYIHGSRINGYLALPVIFNYQEWLSEPRKKFSTDWTAMNALWRPQATVKEAVELAMEQLHYWESEKCPARFTENKYIREPLFACLIVAASYDANLLKQAASFIEDCISSYDWSEIYTSSAFAAECAYFELLSSK